MAWWKNSTLFGARKRKKKHTRDGRLAEAPVVLEKAGIAGQWSAARAFAETGGKAGVAIGDARIAHLPSVIGRRLPFYSAAWGTPAPELASLQLRQEFGYAEVRRIDLDPAGLKSVPDERTNIARAALAQ